MMSLSTVASTSSGPSASVAATTTAAAAAAAAAVSPLGGLDARSGNADEWEKERTALYQQLDEKVNFDLNRKTRIQSILFKRMMKLIILLKH